MVDRDNHRHVEVTDGDHAVAFAEIDLPADHDEPARAALHAESGHLPPGSRSDLVDAVLDLPEIQDREHLAATVPLGDSESLHRLQDRCDDVTTRAAGATALVEVDL